MATSYKTPGVYVEEISKFPPSVAEVETAIPAFVGYTEKAKRFTDNDLHNLPTRIKSLLEFEQFFGKGPSYSTIHVQLSANNIVDESTTTVANAKYNLYESMRLFYDNGGGVCYVCSVGLYAANDADSAIATNITNGLNELKKFDEPTLLLFPDAVNIKNGLVADLDKIAAIQQAALKQCGDLGDRFAILDVATTADDFRSRVGMNNLKYGAAYMPMLRTVYDKTFRLRDISENLYMGNTKIDLKSLFTDADKDSAGVQIKTKIDDFKALYNDNINIAKRFSLFSGKTEADPFVADNLDIAFQSSVSSFNGASTDANRKAALKSAFEYVYAAFAQLDGLATAHAAETDTTTNQTPAAGKPIRTILVAHAGLLAAIQNVLGSSLKKSLQDFRNLENEAYQIGTPDISSTAGDKPTVNFGLFTTTAWAPVAATDDGFISGANITEKGGAAMSKLSSIYQQVKSGFSTIVSTGLSYESTNEAALVGDLPIYSAAVKVLNKKVNTLPPSGAIAGIYAAVDRERGVWKAPANVSINSVSDVSELIDDATQEGLNIDVNAGKSINAIRPFFGKGILVWGSRTLAGNDNEWRYVPVRRLFNFVEESCKKSTSWCVFEPNDANTWARIRGQIDNFLNNIWRRGALAGAKPEHAYYVNCGLGITMTAQDILEGRLIVEVGMAAVRPAEFVILKFSHKLQQS